MGRNRTQPKLRIVRGKYYCTDVYLPSGKRTTIGFGITEARTKGQIMVAFEKWLDLYGQQPHKVLSFKNPYEAIQEIVNTWGVMQLPHWSQSSIDGLARRDSTWIELIREDGLVNYHS